MTSHKISKWYGNLHYDRLKLLGLIRVDRRSRNDLIETFRLSVACMISDKNCFFFTLMKVADEDIQKTFQKK